MGQLDQPEGLPLFGGELLEGLRDVGHRRSDCRVDVGAFWAKSPHSGRPIANPGLGVEEEVAAGLLLESGPV